MKQVVRIDIGKDFSLTPGGRYRREGKWSGEAFREDLLEPRLAEGAHVVVDLDGPEGFMSSFLDEVFGELVRLNGPQILERISVVGSPTRLAKTNFFIERAKAQWVAKKGAS